MKMEFQAIFFITKVAFCIAMYFILFLKYFIYSCLERGEGREKDRERNINVWLPLACPLLGTWPATQVCALTGNWTSDPLVLRLALNPLSHTSQGCIAMYFSVVNIDRSQWMPTGWMDLCVCLPVSPLFFNWEIIDLHPCTSLRWYIYCNDYKNRFSYHSSPNIVIIFCLWWELFYQILFLFLLIYFNPHPRICLLILEKEAGVGERDICVRGKLEWVACSILVYGMTLQQTALARTCGENFEGLLS